jgi:hypothetical protein
MSILSIVMIIWKWPLFQTILDGFTLRELLISYDKTHVPTIDDEGQIGVRKKQYPFQKNKQKKCELEGSISRIKKFLFEEFVHNVNVLHCCSKNCCQHFPCEKTLFLKQDFWGLSFEDHRTYCLNIPRRLHMKGDMKG